VRTTLQYGDHVSEHM